MAVEMGWKIQDGAMPERFLMLDTSSMKMFVMVVIRGPEFLYIAAQYVSLVLWRVSWVWFAWG